MSSPPLTARHSASVSDATEQRPLHSPSPLPPTPLNINAPAWNPLAASLGTRRAAWRALQGTAPHHLDQVISWFIHGFPVPFHSQPPPYCQLSHPITNLQHLDWLENTHLPQLLRSGAISEVARQQLHHCAPAHIVTKRHSDKLRVVLDHRFINRFIDIPHVRFEGLRDVQQLLRSQDHFISFDIENAYHNLPVSPQHRRLLGFNINNRFFEVNSLPFGLAASPSAWHRTMLPVINHFRCHLGLRVVWLLDDVLILCDSRQHALDTSLAVQDLLRQLGLKCNNKKCQWEPTQRIEFLGLTIDTTAATPTFSASPTILNDIRSFASNVITFANRHHSRVPARTLASLAGKVMSVSLACPLARLLTREFYNVIRNDTRHLSSQPRRKWTSWVTVTPQAIADLQHLQHLQPQQLERRAFQPSMLTALRLFTDSSGSGWGAVLHNDTISGPWLGRFQLQHITAKETAAAALALQHFSPRLANKRVLLMCDNKATVSVVNSGTSRSALLMPHVRHIYRLCASHNILLRARWIPSRLNPSDAPSRQFDRHAWCLSKSAFNLITHVFGVPQIDLFADHTNHLLPRFCSFHPSPTSFATDAFTLDWSQFSLSLAVPPFHIVQRVLQHIEECRSNTVLVVPHWPSRPWWADLERLTAPHWRHILLPRGSCRPLPLAHRRLVPEIWANWGVQLMAVLITFNDNNPSPTSAATLSLPASRI